MVRHQGAHIWDTLERIRYTLGFAHKELADRLQLTLADYWSLRVTKLAPQVQNIIRFSEDLDLSCELLFNAKLDYEALYLRFHRCKAVVPERYTVGALSRKRTSRIVLDVLTYLYSEKYSTALLREFQINPIALNDPDELVNIRLITDLLNSLRSKGISREHLYKIGTLASQITINHPITNSLRAVKCPKEVYVDLALEHQGAFDQNYQYSLRTVHDDYCIIMAEPNEEVKDALNEKVFGSEAVCNYKAGLFSSFPALIGLPHSRVIEIGCVHRGDPACLFHVDYAEAAGATGSGQSVH